MMSHSVETLPNKSLSRKRSIELNSEEATTARLLPMMEKGSREKVLVFRTRASGSPVMAHRFSSELRVEESEAVIGSKNLHSFRSESVKIGSSAFGPAGVIFLSSAIQPFTQ
jgi:hypothetical protein